MSAAPVGTRLSAKVRGRCSYLESAIRQRIFDTNFERERVAGLWMEHIFHHGSMRFMLGRGPGGPTDEPVDCVAAFRLIQWELLAPPVEFVAAILQPVRPRDQHLTPTRGAHLVSSVSVDKLAAARRV